MILQNFYLITTKSPFIAPDGYQYQAVWGRFTYLDDNRVMKIGYGNTAMFIPSQNISCSIALKDEPKNIEGYYEVDGQIFPKNKIYKPLSNNEL